MRLLWNYEMETILALKVTVWDTPSIKECERVLTEQEKEVGVEPGDLTRTLFVNPGDKYAALDLMANYVRVLRIGKSMSAYELRVDKRGTKSWHLFMYQAHWAGEAPSPSQVAHFIKAVGDTYCD